jgi:hypothetical protein
MVQHSTRREGAAAEGEEVAMAKTVEYERYIIQSTPQYVTDWEKWRLRIFISLDDHRGVRTREFSAEVLYATEQEADIHGITFGQRLIEGKVEGRSVMDMKTTDRRATPRLRVQFCTTFSASTTREGTGVIRDLSTGGCRIESPVTVEPGVSLELRISVPDLDWPLMIEAASVQWVSGQIFGLAFFQIRDTEHQRLEQVIRDLMEG